MKSSDHRSIVGAKQPDFEIRESKRAHFLRRRIAFAVVRQHGGMPFRDRGTDESGGFGFIVSFHEAWNVAAIPSLHLVAQNAPDVLLGRRGNQRQSQQQEQTSMHMKQ